MSTGIQLKMQCESAKINPSDKQEYLHLITVHSTDPNDPNKK